MIALVFSSLSTDSRFRSLSGNRRTTRTCKLQQMIISSLRKEKLAVVSHAAAATAEIIIFFVFSSHEASAVVAHLNFEQNQHD